MRFDDGVNRWLMRNFRPDVRLDSMIRSYCDYSERTRGFSTRRELPHPEGVLIFNLGGEAAVTGGDGRVLRLRPGRAFFAGVHLRPALSSSPGFQSGIQVDLPMPALHRLVGAPMEAFVDQVIGFDGWPAALGEKLLNAETAEQRIQLLEATLAARLGLTEGLDTRLTAGLHLLRERPDLDICDVARLVGWSRKHLAEQVRSVIGVGPRSFRRLLRFRNLTQAHPGDRRVNWAAMAAEHGYCDQSHLIREFREFAELTPSEFEARLLGNGGGLLEPGS